MVRIFTDLNLHAKTPIRVQPGLGEWGPTEVMTTRRKKRTRILWVLAFIVVLVALFIFGHSVYDAIMGTGA